MVRISFVFVCVFVIGTLLMLPFAHGFVVGQGNRTYFNAGGACMPPGCPPMALSPCQSAMPGPCCPGMPMPMPSKISKCKPPVMSACMPPPCMPPMCGPVCPPQCPPPVAWY